MCLINVKLLLFIKYTCRQFDKRLYLVKHYYLNLLLSTDSRAFLLLSPTSQLFIEFQLSVPLKRSLLLKQMEKSKQNAKLLRNNLEFYPIQNSSININIIYYYTILFLLYRLLHYIHIACLYTFHLKMKKIMK